MSGRGPMCDAGRMELARAVIVLVLFAANLGGIAVLTAMRSR